VAQSKQRRVTMVVAVCSSSVSSLVINCSEPQMHSLQSFWVHAHSEKYRDDLQ